MTSTRSVEVFVGLVVAAAVAIVGWHLAPRGPVTPLGPLPLAFATFAVLIPIAELRPISWLSRDGGGEVTASWTFSFSLLLLGPPGSALLVAAGSSLLVERSQGKPWLRAGFNASQVALALALGHAVLNVVSDPLLVANGAPIRLDWLAAVVLGGAAITALNSALTCTVLALHHGFGVVKTLRQSLDVNLSMDVTLLGLAPIAVVVASESVLLLPMLLGVVAVVYHSAALALANRHDAMHDLLTGLPNRRLFEEQATLSFEPAPRTGGRHGLVHLDLDGFKAINDRLGHHYGDLVLKEVAERLARGKRSQDLVARIGGDEFVLLWPGLPDAETGRRRAQDILALLEEPIRIEGIALRISASIGVALYPEHGEDLSTLLHNADVAMYDAKTRSAGVHVFAPEPGQHAVGRMSLLEDLGRAIGTDQLHLLYQPKLDLPTGRIVGVEALLRWTHPEHGAIAPGRFVALTEQTDLMRQLTEQVMAMAVRQSRQWRQDGLIMPMAINVSARDVQDLRFASRLHDLAVEHEVGLDTLTVELTEHTAMADLSRTRAVLQQLRDHGVRISLDDFGTGYSSLTNLRLLPIDEVKIDRSFVTDMIDSSADAVVVGIIVDLAHRLGMGCVAEGVETPDVLAALRDLGCDTAQGYLIGRPSTGRWIYEMAQQSNSTAGVRS